MEKSELEDRFTHRVNPFIDERVSMRGRVDAPIAIVEYIDFQCPYSELAHRILKRIMDENPRRIKLYLKHMPLDFHNFSKPAARYFEALAMQSAIKAWKFHDLLFERHVLFLEGGEATLDEFSTRVGADRRRLIEDLSNPVILSRIERDQAEAASFGVSGAPSFAINGVVLVGVYPAEVFQMTIDRLFDEREAPPA